MRVPFLAAVLLVAPAALAQDTGAAPACASGTFVTYAIRVVVTGDDSPVPAALAGLSDDDNLTQLDLSTHQAGVYEVHVQYVFPGVAAYTAWRSSERVVAILSKLERESPQDLQASLNVHRLGLTGLFPNED